VRVVVTERGGGFIPWEAVPAILLLAAAAWTAHKVAPYAHVLGVVLAMCATLAGCAVLALAGRKFAQWETRRAEPEPQVLQWRDGQQMREPRR
jgi:uncharacterized membrane protein YdjX (TVP38/TMEM64 family)